jgi:hypothetical protein
MRLCKRSQVRLVTGGCITSGTQIDPEMHSCILTQLYMDTLIAELCPKYYGTESYGRSLETCMRAGISYKSPMTFRNFLCHSTLDVALLSVCPHMTVSRCMSASLGRSAFQRSSASYAEYTFPSMFVIQFHKESTSGNYTKVMMIVSHGSSYHSGTLITFLRCGPSNFSSYSFMSSDPYLLCGCFWSQSLCHSTYSRLLFSKMNIVCEQHDVHISDSPHSRVLSEPLHYFPECTSTRYRASDDPSGTWEL